MPMPDFINENLEPPVSFLRRKEIEERNSIFVLDGMLPANYKTIYIVKAEGYPVHKIGQSKNPKRRIKQSEITCGKLEVIHLIYSTDGSLERELHRVVQIK